MSRLHERVTKLERSYSAAKGHRRIVRHVLDCAPADRPARIAAIEAADQSAFHIVRVIVRPGEAIAA